MKIEIRPATIEDVQAIAQLERECFSHPWSERSIESEFQNSCSRMVAAVKGSAVVGYAGMQIAADEGYINNIAVNEKFRKMGIGKLLVRALAAIAAEEKLAFITLEMRQSNIAAAALYSGCGFEPVGVRRGYYDDPREDAVLMTLRFDE